MAAGRHRWCLASSIAAQVVACLMSSNGSAWNVAGLPLDRKSCMSVVGRRIVYSEASKRGGDHPSFCTRDCGRRRTRETGSIVAAAVQSSGCKRTEKSTYDVVVEEPDMYSYCCSAYTHAGSKVGWLKAQQV